MSANAPLMFGWTPPRTGAGVLGVFVIVSLLLHGLCFYVFQVVYPPTVALLPSPARLNIISSRNPESTSLLRWIEAEDPALPTTTQQPPDSRGFELPPVQHVPSYSQYQPRLRDVPLPAPDLSVPSAAAVGPVRNPRLKIQGKAAERKTAVYVSGLAVELGQPVLPSYTFHASRIDAPANPRFRLGIDQNGAVKYCFISESSGDPALDEQAHTYLLLCRFKSMPLALPTMWAEARILWGNDVSPAKRPSTPAGVP